MAEKYHNVRATVDGIRFDSLKEARRYYELKLLQRAGVICDLKLQPVFELIPGFTKNGRTYRKVVYRADFSYYDKANGTRIIEDVKGFKTDVYKLKKKMFEYKYPDYEIREV